MQDEPPDRWQRIQELLGEALERDPSEREAFLDVACADDSSLRGEVASLLSAHERPGAVDRLGADVAPLAARLRDPSAALVGRAVGRYNILERVGGGGMGVVYKALDARLERAVALKFLQPGLGSDDSAADRFRLEARTVAALEHPNICTVHEIGETDDGQLFLAMPLYEGETLQRRIGRGALAIEEAIGIAIQIARGLEKAHARGIVHRDIKPSNVFLTSDGIVKILDFGIAKLADVAITGPGGPLGTTAYMSPEQAAGGPVDHRSDLWSLGVVLYEMLTGRRPFPGEAAAAVLNEIRQGEPAPVSRLRPEVPEALDRLVANALAKSPDSRYQSAQSFGRDLMSLGMTAGDPTGAAPPTGRRWLSRRSRQLAGGVAAVSLIVVAGLWLDLTKGSRQAPVDSDTPTTVAVLPFTDRSAESGHEYFSDGMTEELIATLARVEGLRVTSSTSAFAFKGRGLDVRTVGLQLGVSTVLEGSVRRSGDRLRITAQLVNVSDGYQLWSETYDRDASDAFAVQTEIARSIAQTLRVRLVGTSGDSLVVDPPDAEAYDLFLKGRHALYLKGRYAWYSRTEEGLLTALNFFQRAVAQSPDYARAHAGVADTYAVLGFYDYLPPSEAFPRAEAAARRAVALDATLAAPRATLGYVKLYHNWDLAGAEDEFQRAIAIDPNYSTAHQWYANLLTAAGRFPEAEREMRRAAEIDPLSLIANAAVGWVLYHAGEYSAALEQLRQTLELNPDYGIAHLWSGWALQELDSLDAALRAHRDALAISDSGALYTASLARSLALAGERAEAEALLRRLESRRESAGYVPSYEIAKIHEALGHADQAFAWLERALGERSHSMVFLRVDPQLSRLRADSRFDRLLKQVFP